MSDSNRSINVKIGRKKTGSGSRYGYGNEFAYTGPTVTDAVRAIIVADPITGKPGQSNAHQHGLADNVLSVVQNTSMNINDVDNLLAILPDLELAMQVKIASILSPNDLVSTELTYNYSDKHMSEISGDLLHVIREFFNEEYQLKTMMTGMLKKAIFTEGSYPIAIIPETSINQMINSNLTASAEDLKEASAVDGSFKILGQGLVVKDKKVTKRPVTRVGLEALNFSQETQTTTRWLLGKEDLGVAYTDNPDELKVPFFREIAYESKVREKLYSDQTEFSLEDYFLAVDNDITTSVSQDKVNELYKDRATATKETVFMKTQAQINRPTVGHPLALVLPPESVIPVHVSSDPSCHMGYFIALDQSGNPIRHRANANYLSDTFNSTTSQGGNPSGGMAQVSGQLAGLNMAQFGYNGSLNQEQMHAENMNRMYQRLLEEDMLERLSNGTYRDNVAIASPPEVYRIMFARACARLKTQLLYVPAAMMTYIAFDYNEYGVGRSILEKTKILGSQRAILSFADNMASVKNSIPRTAIEMEIDEAENDPVGAARKMFDNYINARNNDYPMNTFNPNDIVSGLVRSGHQVKISGNSKMPTTNFDVTEMSSASKMPDGDLADKKRREHMLGLGLPPELVDMASQVDFAAQIYRQNALMTKQVVRDQDIFNMHLTDFVRKYTVNSGTLIGRMVDIIKPKLQEITKSFDNRKGTEKITERQLALHFIGKATVALPEPVAKFQGQLTEFIEYSAGIDSILEAFISAELFDNETLGENADKIDMLTKVVKAKLQRSWMKREDMMPEIFNLLPDGDGDSSVTNFLKEHSSYAEVLNKAFSEFMAKVIPDAVKSDRTKEAITTAADENTKVSLDGDEVGEGDSGGDSTNDVSDNLGDDVSESDTDNFVEEEDDLNEEEEEVDDADGEKDPEETETETEEEGEDAEGEEEEEEDVNFDPFE